MEFDEASGAACRRWAAEETTNFAVAKRTFQEAGYTLPRIVFWNLAGRDRGDGTTSTPVTTKVCGTGVGLRVAPGFRGIPCRASCSKTWWGAAAEMALCRRPSPRCVLMA